MAPSPETEPTRRSYSPEERGLLTIDAVDQWREHQKKALYEARLASITAGKDVKDESYIEEFKAGSDELLNAFLVDKSMPEDHQGYGPMRELYKSASIDQVHDTEWESSPKDLGTGDGTESTRDKFRADLKAKLHENDVADSLDKDPLDPEIRAIAVSLRKKYAKQIAERSKKAGLFESAGSAEGRKQTKEALSDFISAAATEMMDELEARGVPHEEMVAQIDSFIQEQMAGTLIDLEEARSASFRDRSRFTQGALKRWASWDAPKDATWRQRIFSINTMKKGAVFAIPGMALGAVGGLAGGGVLAGAAAVLLARSIARNIAGVRLDNASHSVTRAAEQSNQLQQRMDAADSQVHHDLLELAELQAAEIHSHNRKRLLGGTAISLATAGMFSGITSALGSELFFGKAGQAVKGIADELRPSGDAGSSEVIAAPNEGTLPSSGLRGYEGYEQSQSGETSAQDYIDSHEAGTDVAKGEGWYQTFKDFGVPGQYRDDLLKEIGPELEKMGEAYKTPDGLWGISQSGELSDEASRLIVERAGERGWIDLSLTSSAPEIVDNASSALEEVKPGEGVLQSLQDAGVDNPTLEDVSAVQDQLVQDGAAYANGPDGYAGLNLTENGTMNAAGVETLMDYADNKQLDNSTAVINPETHTVGVGENAVDYTELAGVEAATNDHLLYLETTEMNNDIHEISELLKLNDNEAIAKINGEAEYQDALQYVQQDLKGVMYPGTDIPVMETKYTVGGEHWVFNPVPKESYMPAKAINTLVAYEQSKFALTS